MSKQIDKQMNKRLVALKKGQIAILEALYGCRFGGCRLFWVGLGCPPNIPTVPGSLPLRHIY